MKEDGLCITYPYQDLVYLVGSQVWLKDLALVPFWTGTQKTLGVINQAIPLVYQVRPIFRNAKTMFRIADELKNGDTAEKVEANNNAQSNNLSNTNKPIF